MQMLVREGMRIEPGGGVFQLEEETLADASLRLNFLLVQAAQQRRNLEDFGDFV